MVTNRRLVASKQVDFYPTPPWATQALLDKETFEGEIWEPACGTGDMSEVLKTTSNHVYSSDLYDRGYGDKYMNFLHASPNIHQTENVVTNPPYNLAEDFILKGLDVASRKVCMLLRIQFLEGMKRGTELFVDNPPSRIWVFSERITFYKNGFQKKGQTGGTTAYAWFVWDKDAPIRTEIGWILPRPLDQRKNI